MEWASQDRLKPEKISRLTSSIKKTRTTPKQLVDVCKKRLANYDEED